jgi:hypothetical protein
MRAHPLLAILVVVLGLAACEAMLPVWPEVRAQPAGLVTGSADLIDAARADLAILRQRGALELLRALDATRYLTLSLLLGLILAAGWLSRRYLVGEGADDEPASTRGG